MNKTQIIYKLNNIISLVLKYGRNIDGEYQCDVLLEDKLTKMTLTYRASDKSVLPGKPTKVLKEIYNVIQYLMIDNAIGFVDVRQIGKLNNEYTEFDDENVYPIFPDNTGDYLICYKNGKSYSFNHDSYELENNDETQFISYFLDTIEIIKN